MLKVLKFQNLLKVFVTSDCHFRHDRDFIYKPRGYDSVTEHNVGLIKTWNERVSNEDIVFHLGDFVFKDPTGEYGLSFLNQLNFESLYLLPGNHASFIKQTYQKNLAAQFGEDCGFEVYPLKMDYYRNVFFLPNYLEIEVEKKMFTLCHFPIMSHSQQNRGSFMLCGHSHGNCELTNIKTGQGRRLDVGIDSFGGPISLKEVVRLIGGRDVNSLDHHETGTK